MNGVGGLFILLLARLYYAKILYMCYLAIPMLLRHYPAFSLKGSLSIQPNTWLSENFLARKLASAILNTPEYILGIDVPERVGFLRVDAVIAIKMLAFHSSSFIRAVYVFIGQQLAEFSTTFPPANISKEWGWFLGITAVVVFLIFVHGIARRVGEVIYLMGPPLTILQGNNLHNRDDDTARGVSDSHAWFAHVLFRDVLFGRFMWFRDYFINFRASLLRDSIIVGALYVFMVALSALSFGPAALEAPVLLLCARYLGILILAFFILSVLMVVPCLVCYSAALTIWEDLFWQIVMALLTYAVTKGDFVSRIQIAESFRLPLLQVPGLGMLANIGPVPNKIRIVKTITMAQSRFESEQYMSEAFVESVGGVLFRLSTREICVLHLLKRDEYVLAKGRRNCGETRQQTAVREVTEETGYACRLLPLNMYTRAPPAIETEQLADEARFYKNICEPFTLQVRHFGENQIKLIWWFVVVVDEEVSSQGPPESERYDVRFYSYTDVLDKLTFRMDREMVEKAIQLVEDR
ncbi:hypothetical protein NUW58_g8546 [Xylaria curta]|uniref:Uncharacterized protein n=1 Tax=Xylaria curta TaxID=42375 RepID=A0ACC1N8K7_9PEZI|nr:hypothetical protein NUW58_g8546 [Xylaria curta]